MKIAVIDPSLFTIPYDLHLCEALAAAGGQVCLFGRALRADEQLPAQGFEFRPWFYRRSEARRPLGHRRGWLLGKAIEHVFDMLRLGRTLRNQGFEVVHVQWAPMPLLDRWFLRSWQRRCGLVLTVHDSNAFQGKASSAAQMLGANAVLRTADRLIVHTEYSRQRLQALGANPARVRVIAHGVLRSEPQAEPLQPYAWQSQAAGRRHLILLLGSLKPYKGADVLIRAFADLPSALRAQCGLLILGEAREPLADLKQLAEQAGLADQIIWHPRRLDEAEWQCACRLASVRVFPYRHMDASGALLDALPYGSAIIASDTGGFREILRNGRDGLLTPPGDVAALAAALQRLLEDEPLRERLAQAAVVRARQLADWRQIAAQTLALYRQIEGPARRRVLARCPAHDADPRPRVLLLYPGVQYDLEHAFADRLSGLSRHYRGAALAPAPEVTRTRFGDFQFCTVCHAPERKLLQAREYFAQAQALAEDMVAQLGGVDLVVSYDPLMTGVLGCRIAARHGARLVTEINGDYLNPHNFGDLPNPAMRRLKRQFALTLMRYVLVRADGVRLLFPGQLRQFTGLLKGRSVEAFADYCAADGFHAGIAQKRILFAGFPFHIKGVDVLIAAFKAIYPDFPQWTLRILGYYPDARQLQRHIDGHPGIEHCRPVQHRDMPTQLAACAFLVLPSRSEGMGRVLIEAMAAGKARIGSRVGGIPTVIEDGRDGLLVPANDAQALAAAMRRLIEDEGLRAALAARARQRYEREFTADHHLERLHRLYQRVLQQGPVAKTGGLGVWVEKLLR